MRRYCSSTTAQLPAELISYFRFSENRHRFKLLGLSGVGIVAMLLLSLSTLKTDWEVEQIANHWPPGEDGVITMHPLPSGDKMFTGLFWGLPYARLWDTHTGKILQTVHGDEFSLGPKAKYLLVGDDGEKFVYAVDLNTKEQHDTPFTYEGHATLNQIQFGDSGEVIFHTEETLPRRGSFDSIGSITLWSLGQHSNLGTITGIQLGSERSYHFLDRRNRLVALVRAGDRLASGVWDTSTRRFLGLLTHDGRSRVAEAIDQESGRVAVLERVNDHQDAVEIWDLANATLIRERLVEKTSTRTIQHHHSSFIGIGIELLRSGSLILLGGAETEAFPARLLNVDDLSDNRDFGTPNQPMWLIDDRFLLSPSTTADTIVWDSQRNTTSHAHGIGVDDVKSVFVSPDFGSMVVTTQKASVRRCPLTGTVSQCLAVVDNSASSAFPTLGKKSFGVLMQNGALGLYGYDGVRQAFLTQTHFGDSFEISAKPECNEVLAWAQDGRVLQYRHRWVLFGRGIRDVKRGCR